MTIMINPMRMSSCYKIKKWQFDPAFHKLNKNPAKECKPGQSARIKTETESKKVTVKPINGIYQTTDYFKIKVGKVWKKK